MHLKYTILAMSNCCCCHMHTSHWIMVPRSVLLPQMHRICVFWRPAPAGAAGGGEAGAAAMAAPGAAMCACPWPGTPGAAPLQAQ